MNHAWYVNTNQYLRAERSELNELATYITSRVYLNREASVPRDRFIVKFKRVRHGPIVDFIHELLEQLALMDGYTFCVYRISADNEILVSADSDLTLSYITQLMIYMVKNK
jgi:hypothetical protein